MDTKQVRLGDQLSNFSGIDLNKKKVRLQDLWKEKHLILDFGSGTCPFCYMEAAKIDRLYTQFRRKCEFVFVYTQEAHPGENWPDHNDMSERINAAWRFKQDINIQRNILADHMDNRLKSAFGGGSHMSCIIAKGGRLIFQSNWLDAKVLKTAIEDLLVHAEISDKVGEFQCHSIHFRKFPVKEYIQGLEKNGPTAVMDVVKKIVKRNEFSGFGFN